SDVPETEAVSLALQGHLRCAGEVRRDNLIAAVADGDALGRRQCRVRVLQPRVLEDRPLTAADVDRLSIPLRDRHAVALELLRATVGGAVNPDIDVVDARTVGAVREALAQDAGLAVMD